MLAAAFFFIGMAAVSFIHFRETAPAASSEMRVEMNTPSSSQTLEFALSPDGTRMVFVALDNGVQKLWIRQLNSTAAKPLPGTDGANYPFWSPDNRSVGFFATAALSKVDIDGGRPQTLAGASAGRSGTWNHNGVILFSPINASPLSRVAVTGGTSQVVTHLGPPPDLGEFVPSICRSKKSVNLLRPRRRSQQGYPDQAGYR